MMGSLITDIVKFILRQRFIQFVIPIGVAGFMLSVSAPSTASPPLEKTDAIVLLAGNFHQRAPAAAFLFRNGNVGKVILTNDGVFSGWSDKYNRNLYQIEWAEEKLVALGVPRERIVKLPFYGSGTIYDALAVKRYALSSGMHKMILVTSAYHMRRALWTFRKVFSGESVEVTAHPAVSGETSLKFKAAEAAKLVYYYVKFGLLGFVPRI
jgi:uncharacterized SAM-binding protein YcdF (DUF218 family)